MENSNKNWVKRHPLVFSAGCFFMVVAIANALGGSPSTSTTEKPFVPDTGTQVLEDNSLEPQDSDSLSNDNYYTNVDGNKVHSPAYSETRPIDASARCKDGTYSFSQNRRGTCSHHGGVSEWY